MATKKPASKAADVVVDIEIAIEPRKPISLKLGSEMYTVRPIKGSIGVALGERMQSVKGDPKKLQAALHTVVKTIFGPTDAPKIMARLADTEDDLDFTHVLTLMEKLTSSGIADDE